MEFTWVAIAASLAMGLAAVCVFIFAVKKNYFRNIEDAKYQVFWSDLEDLVEEKRASEAATAGRKKWGEEDGIGTKK